MGAESVVVQFIKDNLKLLFRTDFPENEYKKKKHEFFLRHKRIIGKPNDREIAKKTISYMISKNMIKDEGALEKFLGLPFFKKNIFDDEIFYEELRLKTPDSETVIDLSKMESDVYAAKIEETIKDKVLSQSQSLLDEQSRKVQQEIEDKKKELAKNSHSVR